MKKARILILLIALAAAGGAALLSRGLMPKTKTIVQDAKIDTIEVLVAKRSLVLGETVTAKDLEWQVWPKNLTISGFVTKQNRPNALEEFSRAIARNPLLAGEPINPTKLISAKEGGVMAAILPGGMRAVSVKVEKQTLAGGFILPNDHVDVIMTHRARNGGNEAHVSETILRNVRVLAIGEAIDVEKDKKVADGKTATLELTPSQAETLVLADAMGEVALSLRSLADLRQNNNSPEMSRNPFAKDTGGTVKLLKYGVSSRAYGLN